MTVVVVPVDPPREGLVLPALPDGSPVTPAEATDLYRATVADVLAAVEESGGDLLVNYRPEDLLPGGPEAGGDDSGEDGPEAGGDGGAEAGGDDGDGAEAEVRALAASALTDPSAARYEVQVGSTPSARVGNAVTHLLEREGAGSVAVVPPTAPLVARTHVDSAAMRLRRHGVVLGPATEGRVYFAGFAEPIDFADADAVPAVETLTRRAGAAGLDVDFLAPGLVVETAADLRSLVPALRARRSAGRLVPERTADWVEATGLRVRESAGEPVLVRD